MDKIAALKILLTETLLFSDEKKQDYLANLDQMSSAEIDELGLLLAAELQVRLDADDDAVE